MDVKNSLHFLRLHNVNSGPGRFAVVLNLILAIVQDSHSILQIKTLLIRISFPIYAENWIISISSQICST